MRTTQIATTLILSFFALDISKAAKAGETLLGGVPTGELAMLNRLQLKNPDVPLSIGPPGRKKLPSGASRRSWKPTLNVGTGGPTLGLSPGNVTFREKADCLKELEAFKKNA